MLLLTGGKDVFAGPELIMVPLMLNEGEALTEPEPIEVPLLMAEDNESLLDMNLSSTASVD